MRNIRKIILIIYGLFIGLMSISISTYNPIDSSNRFNDDLRTNGYWELPPIFINGSATGVDAHNWSWVEDRLWFGGGNGSIINPYIIENITIDALSSGNCIEIVDSNEYFILRNCTFSGSGSSDAGLKLYNVNNSKIIDNIILFNNGVGIYLDSSHNNTVFNNEIEYNDVFGFIMYYGDFNNISNNYIRENENEGMVLYSGVHNKVVDNTIMGNGDDGISATYCEYSLFSHNSIIINRGNGIFSYNSHNSIFLNNSVSRNHERGVLLGGPLFIYNITFLHNEIIGNLGEGLHCSDVDDSRFFNNTIEYNNGPGFTLFRSSDNNDIIENSISFNLYDGLYLSSSNNNSIQDNEIMQNDQNGIELYNDCNLNNITLNSINYNHLYGLYLRNSDNNSIIENILIGNENDIAEENCIGNIFINNTCIAIHKIFIELIDHVFSSEEFNITLYIYNENDSGLNVDSIQMWWNGMDVSDDVQNLGKGFYFVLLEALFTTSGEDPILLNITVSAIGYQDKYFETYIAVEPPEVPEPCEIIKHLNVEITENSYSLEQFNLTWLIYNETEHGIDSATIQMWWNGTEVSNDVINLGKGLYFISLDPITVTAGEDPILLSMNISADGYEDKHFETYLAVDPETLEKKVEHEGVEFPFIILIIALISAAGGIGATIITIGILRKKRPTKEVI